MPPTEPETGAVARRGPAAAVADGRNGMPTVLLSHPTGGSVEIYLHGAHLTRWRSAAGRELLFVSEYSEFEPGTAIRGGIPVIFPQFGPGPLPKHGFARTREWELVDTGVDAEERATATLALRDDEATRALWPHAFRLELTVSLGAALELALAVTNEGTTGFTFTTALHDYLAVDDLRTARVEGLQGARYQDQVTGAGGVESRAQLTVDGEVDRVYLGPPGPLRVHTGERVLTMAWEGFSDVVVWNPWAGKARALPDLGDDEYLRMLCVETARVAAPIRLGPGERWRATQRLAG